MERGQAGVGPRPIISSRRIGTGRSIVTLSLNWRVFGDVREASLNQPQGEGGGGGVIVPRIGVQLLLSRSVINRSSFSIEKNFRTLSLSLFSRRDALDKILKKSDSQKSSKIIFSSNCTNLQRNNSRRRYIYNNRIENREKVSIGKEGKWARYYW